MKRSAPPARPRERHLYLVKDEARAVRDIWPVERRVVRAEPRPEPTPPRAA